MTTFNFFTKSQNVKNEKQIRNQYSLIGGAMNAHSLSVKFFSFLYSFREKLAKIIGWRSHLWGWRPLFEIICKIRNYMKNLEAILKCLWTKNEMRHLIELFWTIHYCNCILIETRTRSMCSDLASNKTYSQWNGYLPTCVIPIQRNTMIQIDLCSIFERIDSRASTEYVGSCLIRIPLLRYSQLLRRNVAFLLLLGNPSDSYYTYLQCPKSQKFLHFLQGVQNTMFELDPNQY